MEIRITPEEFKLFKGLVYEKMGISLSDHKVSLVQGRLSKRLRKLELKSFTDYYNYVTDPKNKEEIFYFADAISTNVTSFFREPGQWAYLEENINAILSQVKDKKLRIWSAACSSGEEPYSIAMFLKEHIKDPTWDIKILATDISPEILQKASKGSYGKKNIENIPHHLVSKYFNKIDKGEHYEIKDELKSMIIFRLFNLVHGDFSIFKKKFNIIFCRNVMIYFDGETQKQLVSRFNKLMDKNSLLFIGHSESLTRSKDEFTLIKSSIYKKT